MAAFFKAARLMLSVDCPGVLAWNVSVNTDPSPEIPFVPGGREAVTCRIPAMLSSRFTKATVCPSCESKVPLETFSSCRTRGLYMICKGTEKTFCPPARFTLTVKVEPAAWSMVGGSKLTIALPMGADAAAGCTEAEGGVPAP